jgi:enamine deaminase RidA (YjgF/YER057c/UK114 family)
MNFINQLARNVVFCTLLLAGFQTLTYAQSAVESLKTAVNPGNLPNMRQYGFSQATIAAPGAKTIYVAGQVGMSKEGPNDFKSQVDRSFDNLFAALKAAGGKVEDIVKITVLIKDHDAEKLKILIDKRQLVFGQSPPASTLIPVPVLYTDGVLFEIDCVAVANP